MLTRNRTLIALVLLVAVGLVTACALVRQLGGVAAAGPPTPVPTSASSAPSSSASPSVTPSPSATPTVSVTESAITAAVTNYYKVTDQLEQKPPRDPYKKLWTVTKDEAFDMWQDTVLQDLRTKQHQTGSTKVLSIDVGKSVRKNLYRVNTCVDVSSVDIVDSRGKSVIQGDRPNRAASALLVRRDKSVWYVVQDRDGKQKC